MNQINLAPLAIRILSLSILAAVALSYPLWLNQNDFLSTGFPLPIEPIYLLSATLAAIFLLPQKRILYPILCGFLLLIIASNITRAQIWIYHQGLILILIGLAQNDTKSTFKIIRWGIALAYIWGGFNKINPWFAEFQLDWLLEKPAIFQVLSHSKIVGYGIGFFEFLIGILLIISVLQKYKKTISSIAIVFHLFILTMLMAHQWNITVIPWNLTMIGLHGVLIQSNEIINDNQGQKYHTLYWCIIVFCFGIFPGFSYFGFGQYPLSMNMYSGDQPEATLFFHENDVKKLPNDVAKEIYFSKKENEKNIRFLKLQDWSMKSLKVPTYSTPEAFRLYAKSFCNCLTKPDSAGIEILTVSHWKLDSERLIKLKCKEIME